MGNTANLSLPYPANTDPVANMAAAIQALAGAVDAALHSLRIKRGFIPVNLVGSNTGTAAVTFPTAFANVPTVVCSSVNADLVATATNVTATGFTANLYRPAGAVSFTGTVNWIATDL